MCAVCTTIIAQQNKKDSMNYYLGEVVVVKQKTLKEVVPVQELSGAELERLNAHSVADALRYFAGVQIKDYGGIGGLKTINVRSMGGEHLGVFYDGVEISNSQNGIVDLGRFSLDNMEAISLYNGQKSNILQSAKDFASASALYMKTKNPVFYNNKNYNIRLGFRTGAFDLVNPSMRWEQKINDKVSSTLNVEYLHSSGKYKYRYKLNNPLDDRIGYDTTAVRQNGDIKVWRIEQGLQGQLNNGEWETRAYLYRSDRGYPGAVIRQSSLYLTNQDRQKDLNVFVQGRLRKQVTDNYSTQILGKYAYDYIHYKSDTLVNRYDNVYKLHDFYISSANRLSILPFWSINLSVDYQYNKMDANMYSFMEPRRNTILSAFASSIYWKGFKVQSSILYSLIYDQMSILSRTVDDKGQVIAETTSKKNVTTNRWTPSVVASWQPWNQEQFFVRAFYKSVFRMPTFSEIYMTYSGLSPANLKPEKSTQYDLGLVYTKQLTSRWGVEAQVDGYYNEITDKLMAIGGGANFRWTIQNIGKVKIKGFDLSVATNYKVTKNLLFTGRVTYTYQDAKNYTPMKVMSDSITYKGQIPYIPWNSGSAIFTATYQDWDFNYSYVYTGKRYNNSANLAEYKVKPWYTHDASISRTFIWDERSIRATIEVNNIFNKQYEIISRYPMPGTNFRFSIQANI